MSGRDVITYKPFYCETSNQAGTKLTGVHQCLPRTCYFDDFPAGKHQKNSISHVSGSVVISTFTNTGSKHIKTVCKLDICTSFPPSKTTTNLIQAICHLPSPQCHLCKLERSLGPKPQSPINVFSNPCSNNVVTMNSLQICSNYASVFSDPISPT